MGYYKNAAVCRNGHKISAWLDGRPQEKFCSTCGTDVICACEHCNSTIRGDYYEASVLTLSSYWEPPSFCIHCGKPFPWTATKMAAAKELADELDDLTEEDRAKLKGALDDISRDGPRSEVGAARVKKILSKVGGGIGNALYKVAVDVASEAAKKVLTGGL